MLALVFAVTALALGVLIRWEPPGLRLQVDASTEPMLPVGDPAAARYRQATRDFGDDQVFVIAMETEGIFTRENLLALRRVGDRISRLEGVRQLRSLDRVTHFRYDAQADWIELRPFLDEIPSAPGELAELRRRALADPLYRQTLISADGRTAALNVSFQSMSESDFIQSDLDGRIAAILAEEERPERRFYVSGRPHIKAHMYAAMIGDLWRLLPLGVIVAAGILTLASGTLRGVLLPLLTAATATLWTFAAISVLQRPLNVLTVLLAPTLIAVGSVYGVHVVSRYEEAARQGGPRSRVLRRALAQLRLPVLVAGWTTMVGFGALVWTRVPAIFELGAFSVLGVAAVTLLSLSAIPAVLCLLPLRVGPRRFAVADRTATALDRLLRATSQIGLARPRALVGAFALATLVAVSAIPRIVIDTDYLSFFEPRSPVRVDFDAVNRLLAGTVPIFVVVDGPERGALREPETLRALERIQRRIEAIPGVSRTLSFVDTLRVLNRAVEGDAAEEERIPDSRGGVSELLFLIPKPELQPFATIDHRRANLVVRTGAVGSASLRELTDRIEAVLEGDGLPPQHAAFVTGNAVLLSRAADFVARAQPRTVGLAALTIFLLLTLGLRSPRLGLVAMIPNLVPVLLFYGVLGLGAAPLSVPTSLIGSIALGIAIDATAHLLVRYREERRSGASPEHAAAACVERVGRPIAIASLMLCAGFASVCFSGFAPLREFGALAALTLAICCLTDLLLLPAVLVLLRI